MEKVLVRRGQGKEILLMEPSLFKFHRYLFILGHARSYTTLLCHILGSHRQISGYAETGLCYDTAVDLIRLNAEVHRAGNYRNDSEYVIDKMLYDQITVSDEVLGIPRVIPIFMVREPESAIVSLARMRVLEHERGINEWEEGSDRQAAAKRAAEYYATRLESLQTLGGRLEALGGRGILLPGRCLLDETAAALRFLEHELGLNGPLSEEYKVFEKSGEAGYGDTSTTIRAGRIVREASEQDEIPIPIDLLERARVAYVACLAALRKSPAIVEFVPEAAAA